MHAHHSPRTLAFVGVATLAAMLLLAWFTVVVQEAQTRGQHRRAYQQMTGHIMVSGETEQRVTTGRRLPLRSEPLTVAQRQ